MFKFHQAVFMHYYILKVHYSASLNSTIRQHIFCSHCNHAKLHCKNTMEWLSFLKQHFFLATNFSTIFRVGPVKSDKGIFRYLMSFMEVSYRWLNLQEFFTLAQISQKKVPNHSSEHLLFGWISSAQESDLALFYLIFGDLSQSEKDLRLSHL